jgi:hypothetical protein
VDYDNNGPRFYEWKPVRKSFHELDKFGTILFE